MGSELDHGSEAHIRLALRMGTGKNLIGKAGQAEKSLSAEALNPYIAGESEATAFKSVR